MMRRSNKRDTSSIYNYGRISATVSTTLTLYYCPAVCKYFCFSPYERYFVFSPNIISFGSICDFATMFKKHVDILQAVVRSVYMGKCLPIHTPRRLTAIVNAVILAIVHDGARRMPCWLGCTREM